MILQIFWAWVSDSEPPSNGKVLGEDVDLPAIDRAPAGDDAIAGDLLLGHAEIDGAVGDVHVVFFKRALIQEHVDALAGGQLAFRMLGRNALLAAAETGFRAAGFELVQD